MNGGCERLERDQYSTEACFFGDTFEPEFRPLSTPQTSTTETIVRRNHLLVHFDEKNQNQSGFDFDATVVRKHVIKRSNPEMEESPLTNRDVF